MTRPTPRAVLLCCMLAAAQGRAAGQGRTTVQVRAVARPLLGADQDAPASDSAEAFFDDAAVHDVRIDINSRDWQTLKDNYQSNAYYPCDFRWGSTVLRNVGIRSRGTSSRSGVKPGLRIDFNRYATDQAFLGLKSFVLRNNATDASSMHERMSMLFFRRMGEPAPREAHARLYVNGSYAGLYSIVEAVDKNYLARVFGENDGFLYKFDRNVDDPPYYFEYFGANADRYVPHPFKPETHESDPQPQPLVDLIQTVEEASNAVFRASIDEYLDLAQLVRHVAVEVFLGETDGFLGNAGINNFYLYRPPGQRRHVMIPWDKSETTREAAYPIFHNLDDVALPLRNRLMTRALSFDDVRALYLDTLQACADAAGEMVAGDGRGWMEREIDREYGQIREAVLADPEKAYTNDQFAAAVEALRTFARQRGDFVRGAVADARAQ